MTLWDVESGKARANFGHFGGMNAIVLSPDGKTLATGGSRNGSGAEASAVPGDVRIWDVATGRRLVVLPVPAGRVTRLAFAPDNRTLAVATDAPTMLLWDITAPTPRATMACPFGPVLYLAFAPDGKTLGSGGADGQLRLWNTVSGKLKRCFTATPMRSTGLPSQPPDAPSTPPAGSTTLKVWDFPTPLP